MHKGSRKTARDSDVYEEVPDDPEPLISTIHRAIEKIRKRGDLKKETIKYFEVKDAKFARFYLLPKIHKRLNSVAGRPAISSCGYYTENISAQLDFHLQPLAQAVKSYIKDTNDFLNKLRSLPKLPDNIILCTVDIVGLYPNIPHKEGLSALRKQLDKFGKKTLKQKRGTATGTKFAPPCSNLLMTELEEEILCFEKQNLNHIYGGGILMICFSLGSM